MVQTLLLSFIAAGSLSLLANWTARYVARRIGLVDRPDGHRKLQSAAIPLGGGIGIFVATLVTIGAIVAWVPAWHATVVAHRFEAMGLLVGATLIVLVGTLDDTVGLRGRQKLLGQAAAAAAIWAFNISIDRVEVLGWSCDLGLFSAPFTIFWLLGAMNALNLLDGIDGLTATMGMVLSLSIAFLAMATQHESIALIAAVLAGSTAGFLWFNFPPASMYLGDSGSMLLGLLVGVLAIQSSLKGPGTVLLAAPLALWTIPIFDSAAAIVRRTLTGRSIYTTDRAHLHHHLLEKFGHRTTLACIAVVSTATSTAALFSVWWKTDLIALACAAVAVLMFVVTRLFGHSEMVLLMVRLRTLLRSLFTVPSAGGDLGWGDAIRLQGSRQWELMWEMLTEWASRLELVHVCLDVNYPTLGEGYHGIWNRRGDGRNERYWRMELPLTVDQRIVGQVKFIGERNSAREQSLEHLPEIVEEIERQLRYIVAAGAPPVQQPAHTIAESKPRLPAEPAVLSAEPVLRR